MSKPKRKGSSRRATGEPPLPPDAATQTAPSAPGPAKRRSSAKKTAEASGAGPAMRASQAQSSGRDINNPTSPTGEASSAEFFPLSEIYSSNSEVEAGEDVPRIHVRDTQPSATAAAPNPPAGKARQRPAPPPSSEGTGLPIQSTADIHHHFDMVERRCRMCPTRYGPNTSNTNYRNHLRKHHAVEYEKSCREYGWTFHLQKMRIANQAAAGTGPADAAVPFTREAFLNLLIRLITVCDLPLRLVERPEFRALLRCLRPELRDADIPKRTMLSQRVLQTFHQITTNIKQEIESAKGAVSLTTDLWSDQHRASKMAVTAHYIAEGEDGIQLKTALVAFHHLKGKHDGRRLARTLLYLCDRSGITPKLGHVTMDNATVNDATMTELSKLLAERGIEFNAKDRRVMCLPHTIHIAVTHILDKFFPSGKKKAPREGVEEAELLDIASGSGPDDEDDDEDDEEIEEPSPPLHPSAQTYAEAFERNPVALARTFIKKMRASGQRRDAFRDHLTEGTRLGWFRETKKPEQLAEYEHAVELLLDVVTRWDSTYTMIERLLYLRPAIEHFLTLPANADLVNYRLTPLEWTVLVDLMDVLAVPHYCLMMMAKEKVPVLCGAISQTESMLSLWEKKARKAARKNNPLKVEWLQEGIKWATKYYIRMDNSRAYVFTMFLHPAKRLHYINKHWEEKYEVQAHDDIFAELKRYRQRLLETRALKSKEPEHTPGPSTGRRSGNTASAARRKSEGMRDIRRQFEALDLDDSEDESDDESEVDESEAYDTSGLPSLRTEFQAYCDLHSTRYTGPQVNTDNWLLRFWHQARDEFPTIYLMALDYLAIQASSVPCERVFSSSALTDTRRRNRLSPMMMEALQVVKHWFRRAGLDFADPWRTSEEQMSAIKPSKDHLSALAAASGNDVDRALEEALIAVSLEEGDHDL